MPSGPRREVGLQLIILYKYVKAVAEVAGGLVLGYFVLRGHVGGVERLAEALRHHFADPSFLHLSALLLHVESPRFLKLTSAALLGDGLLSGVEGWSLQKRYLWGPWLVVGATSALVPYEVHAIIRHPHVMRILILLINLAVVLYLARRARREHRALRAER